MPNHEFEDGYNDHGNLKSLGSGKTDYKYSGPSVTILETFPNPQDIKRPYQITLSFSEFTSLCPKTGQPDFASVHISYFPREKCVETKSLKLYLFAYRNEGSFMERIATTIMNDLVAILEPRFLYVEMDFKARGGIGLVVDAKYGDVPDAPGSSRK